MLFVSHVENMRPYLDFEVQRRDGVALSFDHYFKISKHTSTVNGQRLFRTLFTGKNEYHEVRIQNFVQSGSFDQIRQALIDHRETRDHFNQPPLKSATIDNCCQLRANFESVYPELKIGLKKVSVLPIPSNFQIKFFTSNALDSLNPALFPFVEYCRQREKGSSLKPLIMSLDAEWPTHGRLKAGKVALVQIAFSAKLAKSDPQIDCVYLVQLKYRHPFPEMLKELIESPSTTKYLREDWGVAAREQDYIDLGPFCKEVGVTTDGRDGLATLCLKVLGYFLPKNDEIRLGDLSGNLSKQQREYAVLDVLAGLLIYNMACRFRSHPFTTPPTMVKSALDTATDTVTVEENNDLDNDLDPNNGDSENLVLVEPQTSDDDEFYDAVDENESVNISGRKSKRVKVSKKEQRINPHGTHFQRVLLDILHGMMRISLPKLHPAVSLFGRALVDAIWIMDSSDVKNVENYLASLPNKMTLAEKRLQDPEWVRKRVCKYPRQPPEMEQAITKIIHEFSKPSYNDENGNPLLKPDAIKELTNLIKKHIRNGCMVDPLDHPLYIETGTDGNGLSLYDSSRGTNDDEATHRVLELLIQCSNGGPGYIDATLAVVRHHGNIRSSQRYRPNFPKLGHYDHFLIDQVNEIASRCFGYRIHKWWPHTSLCMATSETFGITPCVPRDQYETITLKDVEGYSPFYKVIALKTKAKVPLLPVHTNEEFSLFWRNVSFYTGSEIDESLRTKGGGFDAKKMCLDWNSGVLPMNRGLVPSYERQIFRKVEEHMENAYKLYLKALSRRQMKFKNDDALKSMSAQLAELRPADMDIFLPPLIPVELGTLFIDGKDGIEANKGSDKVDLLPPTGQQSGLTPLHPSRGAVALQQVESTQSVICINTNMRQNHNQLKRPVSERVNTSLPRSFSDSSVNSRSSTVPPIHLRPTFVPITPLRHHAIPPTRVLPVIQSALAPRQRRLPSCQHPNCSSASREKCPGARRGKSACPASKNVANTILLLPPGTLPPPHSYGNDGLLARVLQRREDVWQSFNTRMHGFYGYEATILWGDDSLDHLTEARSLQMQYPDSLFDVWVSKLEAARPGSLI
ncbi:hypothetical protein HDU76_003679 [Blyttiomyces sp. JEL0837]|nr:hypothetical protein HDU76_003679 [Blyttiomyces sp. JEL0837]